MTAPLELPPLDLYGPEESLGHEAIRLAEIAGVELDHWQKADLLEAMRIKPDGSWMFSTVCLAVARQNGKGEILQARELYGAIVLEERVFHTAQHLATSKRALERAEEVVHRSPLGDYCERVRIANGELQLEFANSGLLAYRARSKSGGRGIDDIGLLVYDEAQYLSADHMRATASTSLAAEEPQTWLLGSPGLRTSVVWHGMRELGLLSAGGGTGRIVGYPPGMVWIEYTAERIAVSDDGGLDIVAPDPADRSLWPLGNPSMGADRVSAVKESKLQNVFNLSLADLDTFTFENLGVWEPLPAQGGTKQGKVSADDWGATVDGLSAPVSGLVFGVSVDDGVCSVAAAGRRADGALHAELVAQDAGTGWLAGWLEERVPAHRPKQVGFVGAGEARPVKSTLERVSGAARPKVKVVALSGPDFAAACEAFAGAVRARSLFHLDDPRLSGEVRTANVVAVGDGWAWASGGSGGLTACTVAAWLAERLPARKSAYADRGVVAV